jgi:hexosaminidase
MVDTARHYLSVKSIKETILAESIAKLNVLHIHLTDDESFPIYFPCCPNIS